MNAMKDLLERIKNEMQLPYLSDLKFIASREDGIRDFCDAVSRVESGAFDVHQWDELCCYVWEKPFSFASEEEAKQYIAASADK